MIMSFHFLTYILCVCLYVQKLLLEEIPSPSFLHKSLAMTSECQGVKTHVSRDPGSSETVLQGHQDCHISWDTFVTGPTF